MFMAKDELTAAGKYFKLRLRDARIGIAAVLALMVLLCVGSCAWILFDISGSHDPIGRDNMLDYSWLLISIMPLVLVILISRQESTQKRYSVYPLTNTSRFLAAQMFYHALIAMGIAAVALLYFVQYFFFTLVSVWKSSVVLAFSLSVKYLITGSLVLFMWLALFGVALSFLEVVVRVFKLIVVIPLLLISVTIVVIAYSGSFQGFSLVRAVAFLLPKSPGVFLLRGLLLWFVLFFMAFALNKLASHLRVAGTNVWSSWLLYVPLIAVAGALALVLSMSVFSMDHGFPDSYHDYSSPGVRTISLDASRVPKGSAIEIRQRIFQGDSLQPSELGSFLGGAGWPTYQDFFTDSGPATGEGGAFAGQKIVVTYQLPTFLEGDQKLMAYARPEVFAHLEGTVLNIDYHCAHKINAIYPPIWLVMESFPEYDSSHIGTTLGSKSTAFSAGFIEVNAR